MLVFVGEMGNPNPDTIKESEDVWFTSGFPAPQRGGMFFQFGFTGETPVFCVFLVGGIMFAFDDAWS